MSGFPGNCGCHSKGSVTPFFVAKREIAFKIYLNITPTVTSWASDEKSFSLVFDENPLADFVELPEDGPYEKIWYSNVLCGVIRGALAMVRLPDDSPDFRCN
jgi:Transport protein particle (TRAPP) component